MRILWRKEKKRKEKKRKEKKRKEKKRKEKKGKEKKKKRKEKKRKDYAVKRGLREAHGQPELPFGSCAECLYFGMLVSHLATLSLQL